MWFLRNSTGDITYLKPDESMVVGRKIGCDIVLTNDASISKFHATIIVKPKISFKQNEPSSTVIIQDTNSKYGTFITDQNNQPTKLKPGENILSPMDKIKFGLQHHIYTLHFIPLITSTSNLNTEEKGELQNIMDTLDGVIIDKWEKFSTHLTVSNVTLTVQVAQALAFGTTIVGLEYWHAVSQAMEANVELPSTTDFIPSINEGIINKDSVSLKSDPSRRTLFKDLVFVYFSNCQIEVTSIVKCAGGKRLLFDESQMTIKQLCATNVVVLQLPNDYSQPSQTTLKLYISIQQALKKQQRRLVPESEISLAILYSSIEKYCNPRFNFGRLISARQKSKKIADATILAPDTEDVSAKPRDKVSIINETPMFEQTLELDDSDTPDKFIEKKSSNDGDSRSLSSNVETTQRQALSVRSQRNLEDSSNKRLSTIDEIIPNIESNSTKVTSNEHDSVNEFEVDSKKETLMIPSDEQHPNPRTISQAPTISMEENKITRKSRDSTSISNNPFSELSAPQLKHIKREKEPETNLFSFINDEPKKKIPKLNDANDLFELFEDPNTTGAGEENMFEQKIVNMQVKDQKKKKRLSVSSKDSSNENVDPQIKSDISDHDSDNDNAPLVQYKKQDASMDDTFGTIVGPLFRTDINLTTNDTEVNHKCFVKRYALFPKKRFNAKAMTPWEPEDIIKAEIPVETSSSSDDSNDGFHFDENARRKVKARK
ncbi:nibrin-like isoform X1 [Athalia rosae]|uniref:nibrin-like isoform X1 n=3 Tax=Athalia rosae TaxID=37344 RepID=UPI002033F876|nr:nibrin-like isoform X1 [Athalia rosae]